ncbi:MAG: isoprenylcysteine carboxylmethyltransferase family protein [Pseudomonadales bacterium]|nr:isoprenylcysteine carboxylmethyltransferase family protein [Gammaproteobacteria bacterium]NNL56521.1 isoprenylcysteine carboxylmethyltransferase family protein [Pseudomonadales bacterium]
MSAWLDNRIPPPLVGLCCALGMYVTAAASEHTELAFTPNYWLALPLLMIALACMFLSIREFARHRTTVNPLNPGSASKLVSSGIFAYSRNPMYLALLLILASLGLAWGSWLGVLWLLLCMLYLHCFQIYPEERAMLELFGESYADYCRRVRRWC